MSRVLKKSDKIKLMLRFDRAFFFVFKAAPFISIFSFILVIILGLLPLVNIYLIKLILDKVGAPGISNDPDSLKNIIILVAIAGASSVIFNILSNISNLISRIQGLEVSDYVFGKIHEKSVEMDLEYYENSEFYDTLHRAQQEGPYRPQKIVNGVTSVIQNLISLVGVTSLLFFLHWGFALILAAAVIPSILVRLKFSSLMYDWINRKTMKEREAGYLNWLITGYINAKEIRLFRLGKYFSRGFSDLRQELRQEEKSLYGKRSSYEALASVFSTAAVFTALGYAALKAGSGDISVGDMVMFFQAFQKGLTSMKAFFTGIADLYEDNLFISHLYKFLDLKPEIEQSEKDKTPFPEKIEKGISFKNVSFSYPGSENQVLKNISFEIKKGEVCALVGENGAGKSTIARLAARLYDPDSGRVKIDSVDIRDYDLEGLRSSMGVLLQDFAKYHFSAEENIRVGNLFMDKGDKSIKDSAEKAGADGFIEALPDKYETILGKLFKDGVEISQGEWQKTALSRTFLRASDIVILDEPASSLDAKSEYEIFNKVKKLLKGKTSLIISHRFSTVKSADRIIVLNNGSIEEEGSHEELISKNGMYKKWYEMQVEMVA